MVYSKLLSQNEAQKSLKPIKLKNKIESSGVPMIYDDKCFYLSNSEQHTLVVGSTGSGKTQCILLPMINLSMMANESIIVTDPKGEIYNRVASQLEKENYQIFIFNPSDIKHSNLYNPLLLPYYEYKNGNIDWSNDELDNIGYYLLNDNNSNADPFWINSAINYFKGLVFYAFDHFEEKNLNLINVFNLVDEFNSAKSISKVDGNSKAWTYLNMILSMPNDTMESILSVFKNRTLFYTSRDNFKLFFDRSDFEFRNINKKFAIFFVGNNNYNNSLIPLFVNQLYGYVNLDHKLDKIVNVILDEFDYLTPFKDFTRLINYSRGLKIRYTVIITSYTSLKNKYGEDDYNIIKLCFGNYLFLSCNDLFTLDEFSMMCGRKNANSLLITAEELRTLKMFEAIVLVPRMMPFKSDLMPDYRIDWGYERKEKEIPILQKD